MSTLHESSAPSGLTVGGIAKARIERNLVMTPEADSFLADLARRTGLKEGEVIRTALSMFKTAVDAKEQGKHVGITGSSDALDIELVGF